MHALVEALVAAAEQRERRLRGELGGQRVVEAAPAGGQRDHPPVRRQLERVDAVARAQRRLHHVRPGSPSRRRRRRACRPPGRPSAAWWRAGPRTSSQWPERLRVAHVALAREPLEPAGKQREDVDLHQRPRNALVDLDAPRRPGPPSATASETNGTSVAVLELEQRAGRARRAPGATRPCPRTSQPTRSAASHSSSVELGLDQQRRRRAAARGSSMPLEPDQRALVGPGAALDRGARARPPSARCPPAARVRRPRPRSCRPARAAVPRVRR